jgi:hypothetical protein
MNFNTLLANKEYKTVLRTDTFLFIELSLNHYIFYSERQEPQCFHLEAFSKIDPITFFENNYAMSQVDINDLQNSELSVNLIFLHEPVTSIIGKCFRIVNFQDVLPNQVINEEAIRFVQDFHHKIPPLKWKFSIEEQFFYFIPDTTFCIKFNSNVFFKYGVANYNIMKGPKTNIFFLNPYTMFDYYKYDLPDFKNDSISIGNPKKNDKTVKMIIRGTKKELITALQIVAERHHLPFTINHNTITLHFIKHVYDDFHNSHFNKLADALRNDYAYLKSYTNWNVEHTGTIRIKANSSGKNIYPVLEIKNDSTRIQIILHYLLNELYPDTQTIITTYRSIDYIDIDIESSENYEEIPDDVLITYGEEYY